MSQKISSTYKDNCIPHCDSLLYTSVHKLVRFRYKRVLVTDFVDSGLKNLLFKPLPLICNFPRSVQDVRNREAFV